MKLRRHGSFADLLRLVAAIDGIDRIRFTTSHPIGYRRYHRRLSRYAGAGEFLHLPVQSGSDRVLNLMGRTHTALEYKAIIRKLREARPGYSDKLRLYRRLPRQKPREKISKRP
ncbi:radical SAM protein [Klebsiella pneumoniae]|nr:radical SAM protein [Klebsiella pneumoniae]